MVIAELFVFVITLAAILVRSLLFDAPLTEPVNVMHPPNPAQAPWYFLGLQEMVRYWAFWGGVGIPTIFVILLVLLGSGAVDKVIGHSLRLYARGNFAEAGSATPRLR